jgi:hypothetical protein
MSCTVTRLTLELEQSACHSVQTRMIASSACKGGGWAGSRVLGGGVIL